MVIYYKISFFFFFFFFTSFLPAQHILIDASIDQNQGIAGQPLKGMITITHQKNAMIDKRSFQLDGHSLSATLIKQVNLSAGQGDTLISIYEFELPAKPKGLYTLDPITVNVDGKNYRSVATSYEVKGMDQFTKPQATSKAPIKVQPSVVDQSPIIFRLEAAFQGPSPFYPGQRGKLLYRITYNRNIDLSLSQLPLLHTQEFKKVGDEQVKDYEVGHLTYQDISQEIEAFQPGTFHYGPSAIEGYAYQINAGGQKIYLTKLRTEAPAIDVVVKPFPIEEQPASFNGAIGELDIQLKPPPFTEVNLGDPLILEIAISGATNLADLRLPDLNCQPGFSGFFQLNDLPPLATIKNGIKYFKVELKPISIFAKEIPSIEISSFDPQRVHYIIWRSLPIPLKLTTSNRLTQPKQQESNDSIPLDMTSLLEQLNTSPPPIEIQGLSVTSSDLQTHWLHTYWVLFLIPLGIFLIFLQSSIYQKWQIYKNQNRQLTSKDLLATALNSHQLKLLKEAFLHLLREKGYLPIGQELENLSSDGVAGEIKLFVMNLESLQYGFDQTYNWDQIHKKAEELFNHLNE